MKTCWVRINERLGQKNKLYTKFLIKLMVVLKHWKQETNSKKKLFLFNYNEIYCIKYLGYINKLKIIFQSKCKLDSSIIYQTFFTFS